MKDAEPCKGIGQKMIKLERGTCCPVCGCGMNYKRAVKMPFHHDHRGVERWADKEYEENIKNRQ